MRVYHSQRLQKATHFSFKKKNELHKLQPGGLADENFFSTPGITPTTAVEAQLAKENFDEAASAAKDRRAIWKAKRICRRFVRPKETGRFLCSF